LFWCDGGAKVPVSVRLAGGNELLNYMPGVTDSGGSWEGRHHPFAVYTESPMGDEPYLSAVSLSSEKMLTKVFYMHSAQVKQQCDSGNRIRNVVTPLEQLLADYNINIFDEVKDMTNQNRFDLELLLLKLMSRN